MPYFGVVYSKASGFIRRYVVSDDSAIVDEYQLLEGEALLKLPVPDGVTKEALTAAAVEHLTAMFGKPPSAPRCAVIDANGNVVSVIMADPAVDLVPGMTLVLSDEAHTGWTWTKESGFVKP